MQALSAAQIVRIWERGAPQSPVERALTILAEADPGTDAGTLADLPIGARDERLLALRAATFGGDFAAVGRCERCGERLEFTFTASDVRDRSGRGETPPRTLTIGGVELDVRPLTSRDLAAATACADADAARLVLARRCVGPRAGGAPVDVDAIAGELLPALARALETIDPDAVRTLEIHCPGCSQPREYELDVAAYLWAEIEVEALRLLRDVHAIARAYGWREAEILALSPLRRRAYLELVVG